MLANLATTASTRFLNAGGTQFAYRRFGNPASTPLVFTQHFMGNLDNLDPAIAGAPAAGREVILFDNAGVGASTGTAPDSVDGIAAGAASFISGLGLPAVDLLGHSMGGEVAQLVALDHPALIRPPPRAGGHRPARRGRDSQAGTRCRSPLRQARRARGGYVAADHVRPVEGEPGGRPCFHLPDHRAHRGPGHPRECADHRRPPGGRARVGLGAGRRLQLSRRVTQAALVGNGSDDIVIPTINSTTCTSSFPTPS